MCWALRELGCDDPRLMKAIDWMARTVTGEGIAPLTDKHAEVRYYAYKCGPGFACGVNGQLPCAWGAVKVMLAFGKVPVNQRTPLMKRAIKQGVDFLFSVDPATAAYRHGMAPSPIAAGGSSDFRSSTSRTFFRMSRRWSRWGMVAINAWRKP